MGSCASTENSVPEGYKALKVQSVVQQQGDVRDFYTFDKQLGKGNFGIVHLVYDKKTNEKFACKSISKVSKPGVAGWVSGRKGGVGQLQNPCMTLRAPASKP